MHFTLHLRAGADKSGNINCEPLVQELEPMPVARVHGTGGESEADSLLGIPFLTSSQRTPSAFHSAFAGRRGQVGQH